MLYFMGKGGEIVEHKEYKRIISNADKAVLFIHGIAGTPNHFRVFMPLLPKTVSVYNLLLDGHGKGVQDFSHTSMKKWKQQVQSAIDELSSTHKTIYVVAHSMGTLLAIRQAVQTRKIAAMFLLAVPIKLFIKPAMFANSLKIYFNLINPKDKIAVAAKNAYGIAQDKNPLHYIGWIPRYCELFAEIRKTRKILPNLVTPCTAYQSSKDEIVSKRSVKYLKEQSNISVVPLPNSRHYYYETEDLNFLMNEFKKQIC